MFLSAVVLLTFTRIVFTSQICDYTDDSDLFSFVTRPDIRSPRFDISIHKPDAVTPGYWFTAPYGDLHNRLPSSLFQPGQAGPHIYDNNGDLIWSGSHLFGDRATFDFKVVHYNGSDHLTFIAGEDLHETDSPGGSGVVLDNSYQHVRMVDELTGKGCWNMHEMNTVDDGRRALMITYSSKFTNVRSPEDGDMKMFVGNNGFSEVDAATSEPLFTWWALDHLEPSESRRKPDASAHGNYGSPWDFFHLNSVDKTAEGDYLISARYTDTIYKISGKDGSIVWRLGGVKSDFKLIGFNFSAQHDARWRGENDTAIVLTFFNNHSDGTDSTADTSSAMEVALDKTTMSATLVHEWQRPDGQLTKLRGNAQRLPNGHMFVGWSENTYISEFDSNGEIVLEAEMASHRFNTYRTYKFNFTGYAIEPIAVKAFAYGTAPETSTTVVYVSWNGATEVIRWNFYASDGGTVTCIGSAARTGFETMFMTNGVAAGVLVEAIDGNGRSLGRSEVALTTLPPSWGSDIGSMQTFREGIPACDLQDSASKIEPEAGMSQSGKGLLAIQQTKKHASLALPFWDVPALQRLPWLSTFTSGALIGALFALITWIIVQWLRRSRLQQPGLEKNRILRSEV